MCRGFDGTDLLARGVLALLARNRLEIGWRIVERVVVCRGVANCRLKLFVVAVDADPMHFAAAHYLILADHGNIVLGLAATTQALQPLHLFRSMAIAHLSRS